MKTFARWSSDVILRYVREAPLESLTADFRRFSAGQAVDEGFEELGESIEEIGHKFVSLEEQTKMRFPAEV